MSLHRLAGRAAALLAVSVICASPAAAKSYFAERFDVQVRVLPDGTLDVTETAVFRFESGTFREVFREIPLRRTDGIDVLHASMEDRRLPPGTEPGTVDVRRRGNRIRVTWRFSPVEGVTRAFELAYRVRGAIRQEPEFDLLAWRALPDQHAYPIASSTVTFDLPTPPSSPPSFTARRARASMVTGPRDLTIHAGEIRRNGWVEASVPFASGAVVSAPPAWQQRAADLAARGPTWSIAAAGLTGFGLLLLAWLRQGYERPPVDLLAYRQTHQPFPPEAVNPAVAGVLASNGQPALQHGLAALFALAERGELEVRARRGVLGQRDFIVARARGAGGLQPHERAAIDLIFKGAPEPGATVTLSQARSRLTSRFGRFKEALRRELAEAGLLDDARQALRRRYQVLAIGLVVAGTVAFLPAGYLAQVHGGWPLLVPVSILVLAFAAAMFAETITPLSNDGLRRASRWRAYRQHLRAVARGEEPSFGTPAELVLPLSVALGLAAAWARHLKREGTPPPPWFQAAQAADVHAAFPAFVAAGGGGTAGGAGGAGAAGGGASGAG